MESGGFAKVAHFLSTYPVTVDVMGRAPSTSSTAEAVRSCLGDAEQLILEAIDLEQSGFRGDFICVDEVKNLLRTNGYKATPQDIPKILNNVGYIRHPGLERTKGVLKVNAKRLLLYVKKGSDSALLDTPQQISQALKDSQGGGW